jgi:2-hydroxychromene-2-carboxylate isomerase
MAGVIFYGDFNCPFCFVENERLDVLEVSDVVEFRCIEHMPRLPSPWDPTDAELGQALDRELERVMSIAPDIPIARPLGVPSSRVAIETYVATRRQHPQHATAVRRGLFRALWRDGLDLSDAGVVAEVLGRAGVQVQPDRTDRIQARIWRTEWMNAAFDERIPVLATATGERLLGLATGDQIRAFVADPVASGRHHPDVCRAE